MNFSNINNVYFIGIGGIGMSALARYFNAMGKSVSGYDKTSTALTQELISEGIEIHFEDNIDLIAVNVLQQKEQTLVVYTPAVPSNHKELNYFIQNNFEIKKRAEVLGSITKASKTIAVAGTHGKTTTSSLVAHIFKSSNYDPTAFLGGITKNYNTNLLLSSNLGVNDSIVVVEADEYDRSFLTLFPEIAVITSADADHLDIYGDVSYVEESFSMFANQVSSKLILKKSIESKIKTNKQIISYSIDDSSANYFASNITISEGQYHYEIHTPKGVFKNMTLGLPGKHNVENAIAAVAIASEMGLKEEDIRTALESFKGVKRRFDYQIKTNDLVFIDDYAHHPEELKATIGSAKAMFPTKKITGIFQPHLYSRTRDFAKEFAASLDLLDECILMEIYPARELPIEGVNSKMLLELMTSTNKLVCSKTELILELNKRKIEVLLTMGAGDIDMLVEPIKNAISKK